MKPSSPESSAHAALICFPSLAAYLLMISRPMQLDVSRDAEPENLCNLS